MDVKPVVQNPSQNIAPQPSSCSLGTVTMTTALVAGGIIAAFGAANYFGYLMYLGRLESILAMSGGAVLMIGSTTGLIAFAVKSTKETASETSDKKPPTISADQIKDSKTHSKDKNPPKVEEKPKTPIELFLNGADIKGKDSEGNPPLHRALRTQPDLIPALIQAGADINATNEQNQTVLHRAIIDENVEVAKELIPLKANVKAADSQGNTPLHYAAKLGNKELIQALIGAGADISVKNLEGQNPLAFRFDQSKGKPQRATPDTVELLMSEESLNVKEKKQRTPIHRLSSSSKLNNSYGSRLLHEAIRKGGNKDDKDEDGNTPLHLAVIGSIRASVHTLVEENADCNITNNEDKTPLQIALENQKERIADILIPKTDLSKYNYLKIAVLGFCSDVIIDKLLEKETDPNRLHEVLLLAIESKSEQLVRKVAAKMDLSSSACVPLAVKAGCSKETIQALLDSKADINAKIDDKTALEIALDEGNEELVKLLATQMGKLPRATIYRVVEKDFSIQTIEDLIEIDRKGVEERSKAGATAILLTGVFVNHELPLTLAIRTKKNDDLIRLLIKHTGMKKDSFLLRAMEAGSSDTVIEALLEKGANPNVKQLDSNITPLHLAISIKRESAALMLIPKMNFAEVQEGEEGDTLLHQAIKAKLSLRVITALLKQYPKLADAVGEYDATISSRRYPLTLAIEANDEPLIEAIAEVAHCEYDFYVEKAIIAGCSVKIIRTLLQRGAEIDAAEGDKLPLDLALEAKNEPLAQVLAEKVDFSNTNYLHQAVAAGFSTQTIETFMQHGANPDAVVDGKTPLHIALEAKNEKLIETLAKRTDLTKHLFLHAAIESSCDVSIVRVLMNAGADCNAQNKDQKAPLNLALSTGNKALVDLLTPNTNLSKNNYLLDTIRGGASLEVVRPLINEETIKKQDYAQKTALHLAIENTSEANQAFYQKKKVDTLVQFLLSSDADVNIQNMHGETPLYTAIRTGKAYLVNQLLATGRCDLTIKDNAGRSFGDLVTHHNLKKEDIELPQKLGRSPSRGSFGSPRGKK